MCSATPSFRPSVRRVTGCRPIWLLLAPAEGAEIASAGTDLVVALTSYNDVRTIGAVSLAVRSAFEKYFASRVARIVLADAGSTDGTREAAREAVGAEGLVLLDATPGAGYGTIPYHGHPDRAGALRAILQAAKRMDAKACAVLDAGLADRAEGRRLIAPVLTGGLDYVSPYYLRRVHEGGSPKAQYPLFRALAG